jgi:hypothetical protein
LYLLRRTSDETAAPGVKENNGLTLSRNVTASFPSFVVERLDPASILEARIYASNREGRSDVARVKARDGICQI